MSKVIIEKPDKEVLIEKGVFSWPVWEKEISEFEWTYVGDEQCYIIEGEFDVESEGSVYHIKAGDFVTFKDGLQCVWKIIKPVKKHYNFL